MITFSITGPLSYITIINNISSFSFVTYIICAMGMTHMHGISLNPNNKPIKRAFIIPALYMKN